MPTEEEIVHVFPSANWSWERVKLSERPQGTRSAAAGVVPGRRRKRRQPRGTVQVVVTYRGGPQACYTLRCDGFTWKYPGFLALDDVMTHFNMVRP